MTDSALTPEDTERLIAAVEMIGRTGATGYEVGFDDDTTPTTWWAQAFYRGARKAVDGHPGPVAATEDLLRRLVSGGQCVHCRRATTLGATALPGRCAYVRRGATYLRSCTDLHPTVPAQEPPTP